MYRAKKEELVFGCLIIGAFVTILITILFVAIIIPKPNYNIQQQRIDSFKQNCSEQEGHIYSPDDITWCLTQDGRIVEVYP